MKKLMLVAAVASAFVSSAALAEIKPAAVYDFGVLQASSDYLPVEFSVFGQSLGNISPLINSLPYILVLVLVLVLVLMIFIGKSVAPAAVGVPYKKER